MSASASRGLGTCAPTCWVSSFGQCTRDAGPGSAVEDGAALSRKEASNREVDYPDVEAAPDAALLCLAVEVFGRWGKHPLRLVRELIRRRVEGLPPVLRAASVQAYSRRWWSILGVAVQRAVAETALRESGGDLVGAWAAWTVPPLSDVLADAA